MPSKLEQLRVLSLAVSLFAGLVVAPVWGANATDPGTVTSLYPTVTNLAVEWVIDGDDNLNAVCPVEYRRAGETRWMQAMPLVRVPAGSTGKKTSPSYGWQNKLSGSVFDLRPGTAYEIKLSLRDPDGGKADTTLRISTRPVPAPAKDARIIKVDPRDFVEKFACAEPGDIFELTPGYYYQNIRIERDGTPGRPIVIRGSQEHPQIGSTFPYGLDLTNRRHLIIENLTCWRSVDIRGAVDVTVRRCKVFADYGIIAQYQPGARDCYIADNEVSWLMPWVTEGMISSAPWGGAANFGEGIEITGPGNVICYNRVRGYRDCISTMEDLWVYDQSCVDIYNNDIYLGTDDAIEADLCSSNCRILRNRITNCGMGLSAQPSLGGPNYYIRNMMYNVALLPYKLERQSYGAIFLHNTSVQSGDALYEHHGQKEYYYTVWLNNLAVGGKGGGLRGRYPSGTGLAVSLPGFGPTCTFDYNAVGAPGIPFAGLVGDKEFKTLAELNKLSGGHSVQAGMESFAPGTPFPEGTFPEREPQDLRLVEGSAAVDAAKLLPNVNDNYSGKAPDIGAYELGAELEHYGPRPAGMDELTEWERRHGK